jgi:hypothetical protein
MCDFEKSIIDSEIFTRLLKADKKWRSVNEREECCVLIGFKDSELDLKETILM